MLGHCKKDKIDSFLYTPIDKSNSTNDILVLHLLENRCMCLYSKRGSLYALIFQYELIFKQGLIRKAYVFRSVLIPQNVYFLNMRLFPRENDCKAYMRLFSSKCSNPQPGT